MIVARLCDYESIVRCDGSVERTCVYICMLLVNGEPRLRHETNEMKQLRSELLTMRDRVERLIDILELTSFAATSATVATDNDALPSNGRLPANR